jgi:hypothetical protein
VRVRARVDGQSDQLKESLDRATLYATFHVVCCIATWSMPHTHVRTHPFMHGRTTPTQAQTRACADWSMDFCTAAMLSIAEPNTECCSRVHVSISAARSVSGCVRACTNMRCPRVHICADSRVFRRRERRAVAADCGLSRARLFLAPIACHRSALA